jgi:ketosteroid isomerase-like protein
MKSFIFAIGFCLQVIVVSSQYNYEPSEAHPYGLPNPEAPQEVLDFAPIIGECDCKSVMRNADQSWGEPMNMIWRFKYIMNGLAVQDETLKEDGKHAGSIRQFVADSTRWYVHFYSSNAPSTILPAWEGTKTENGNIILYREQTAPNGMEGFYKITFSKMNGSGFKWLGEWVNPDETISYPTWKIDCTKRSPGTNEEEKSKIIQATKAFSNAYMNKDYETMANAYVTEGKIFPDNSHIMEGKEAIKNYWIIPEGSQILHHEISPIEINFIGDYAYDYGYYQGKSKFNDGRVASWKGKYVVVWKKEGADWKMYLDIWNRVPYSE